MAYPPIAAHGRIGDLHTAARAITGGTVDWRVAGLADFMPMRNPPWLRSGTGGCARSPGSAGT
jgi:hypothetical protein